MNHPLYNNALDYRGFASITPQVAKTAPSMINAIAPKTGILAKLTQGFSLSKLGNVISGAQKVVNLYNQVTPIIKQSKPLINNIRTTIKVAKAFKKMNKDNDLEKAFDDLPDYSEDSIKVKKEDIIDIVDIKNDNKIPSPFFNP